MINHISLAVNNPSHVAEVVAELWQGQAAPFPHHPGYYITFAMDSFGSLIEFLPKKTVLQPNLVGKGVQFSDLSSDVPVHTATHANIMVPISEAQIYAIAEREGWRAVRCKRSDDFELIEFWLENEVLLELLPPTMSEQYLIATRPENLQTILAAK